MKNASASGSSKSQMLLSLLPLSLLPLPASFFKVLPRLQKFNRFHISAGTTQLYTVVQSRIKAIRAPLSPPPIRQIFQNTDGFKTQNFSKTQMPVALLILYYLRYYIIVLYMQQNKRSDSDSKCHPQARSQEFVMGGGCCRV